MIGLYLLSTEILKFHKTIKFGMSMRIQYRWIDYMTIFSDAKYEYYYEFLDKISREEILNIESQIIVLHQNERNYNFQTEYFIVNTHDVKYNVYFDFHQSIINVLKQNKIKYIVHDIHDFYDKTYDNKPEPLIFECNTIIKLNRYGQNEALYYFKEILLSNMYWGLLIAPTGWGKTLMHLIFFGHYLHENPLRNTILITKKKDLLNDINNEIKNDIINLHKSGYFKNIPHIEYCVDDSFDPIRINNLISQSIIIINIDKIINKKIILKKAKTDNTILEKDITKKTKTKKVKIENKEIDIFDPLKKIKLINWSKIGFIIFDEVHHIGSNCAFDLMTYVKNETNVKYCIGSSATPVRNNFSNQNNIRQLFNKSNNQSNIITNAILEKEDINILHEITYKEAWDKKNNFTNYY